MRTNFTHVPPISAVILIYLLLIYTDVTAQIRLQNNLSFQQEDSLALEKVKKSFFEKDAVRIGLPPAVFFAASAATWSSREKIREVRNRYIPSFAHHYDDYMQYMPAVSVYALNLSGIKGRNKLGRTTISYATSAAIMAIIVNSVKYTAKVERPDGSRANSFPSGHTSNAFMNATFMHKEFGHINPMYSIAGYSMSTFTGVGRGLNNRHWISDVLAGAGIGILSTQLGYFFVNKFYKNAGDRPGDIRFDNPLNKPSYLSLKLGFASATHNLVENLDLEIRSKTGFEAGLDGAYYFTKNWGLGGDFSFVSFPISTNETTFSDPDLGSSTSSIVTQSLGALNFTIGPHYTYEINHNWLLQVKFGAGIATGATGKISFKYEDDDDNFLNDEIDLLTYKPARTFKMNGGLAFTRMLNSELGITVYADYHYLKPVFTYTIAEDFEDPDPEPSAVQTFKEKNNMNYITAGLKLTAFF
ncbi:phosphatase PAP2 family protein [Olivibacter sp. CPCC 100613]|uniref:phosphatase PAP2 family protein n=1 Tax=Olivibacter sp. CPCC 100613 TaxID=3079931 RepID=UPI002FF80BC6